MAWAAQGSIVTVNLGGAGVTFSGISLPSVAAGEVIVVWGFVEAATTGYTSVSASDDATDTFTAGTFYSNGNRAVFMLVALAPTAGTRTISVTFNGGSGNAFGRIAVSRFSGGGGTYSIDKTGSKAPLTASPNTATASGANAQADALVLAAYSAGNTNVASGISDPPTGYTSAVVNQNDNTDAAGEAAYKVVTATETSAVTYADVNGGGYVSGSVMGLWTLTATASAAFVPYTLPRLVPFLAQ